MTDEKIFSAIKNRDEHVMALVIQKYSKLLWSIVSAVLANSASVQDVEECVADVFIDFWLNYEKYAPEKGKLSSWLSMVARSKAIDNIAGDEGDEVYAVFGGEIIETGFDSTYGNYLLIDVGSGVTIKYGHLKEIKEYLFGHALWR